MQIGCSTEFGWIVLNWIGFTNQILWSMTVLEWKMAQSCLAMFRWGQVFYEGLFIIDPKTDWKYDFGISASENSISEVSTRVNATAGSKHFFSIETWSFVISAYNKPTRNKFVWIMSAIFGLFELLQSQISCNWKSKIQIKSAYKLWETIL